MKAVANYDSVVEGEKIVQTAIDARFGANLFERPFTLANTEGSTADPN